MAADRLSFVNNGLYMTEEQYLALDASSDAKYERLDGIVTMLRPPSSEYGGDADILNMAGGSLAHAALCARIGALLYPQLRGSGCMVYSSDGPLKMIQGNYTYPDVTVACGENQLPTTPTVIIEVLSPNTEKRDRDSKMKAYKRLPSLQEYVLVGSEYRAIEVYRREGNFWRQFHYLPGDVVELTSIGVSFPFDEVYEKIL